MPEPTVYVRQAVLKDLKSIMKIEKATFGCWTAEEFGRVIGGRMAGVWCSVAATVTSTGGERVVGLIVIEVVASGVTVLNMAATWPSARMVLIEKAKRRAERNKTLLTWEAA